MHTTCLAALTPLYPSFLISIPSPPPQQERGVEVLPCFSRVPVPLGSPGYWGYVQVRAP